MLESTFHFSTVTPDGPSTQICTMKCPHCGSTAPRLTRRTIQVRTLRLEIVIQEASKHFFRPRAWRLIFQLF
jgi:hypothetical protein